MGWGQGGEKPSELEFSREFSLCNTLEAQEKRRGVENWVGLEDGAAEMDWCGCFSGTPLMFF